MNPKINVVDSKQNGGTGNSPVPRGNLPRGSRHARGTNWFAFNEMSRAQFRRASGQHLFIVAQIFDLPYRRFSIGRRLLAGGRWQVTNLRYSANLRYGRGQHAKHKQWPDGTGW